MLFNKRPPERNLNSITIKLTNDELFALRREAEEMRARTLESAAAALLNVGMTTNGFRRMRRRRSAEERRNAARLAALAPPVDLGPADCGSDGSQVR